MKKTSRLIALLGLTVGSAYVINKIQKTQAIKPNITVKLPEPEVGSSIVLPKSTLSKAMTESYKAQIIEMTKSFGPRQKINLVHYVETNDKRGLVVEKILEEAGYEKIAGPTRTMYKKKLKADAQTISDAVIFTAQTAKTHKLKYFGWDFSE